MRGPLDAEASSVPSSRRGQLVLVDGRTFAISDEAGLMRSGTDGMVHDDLRHLSEFVLSVADTDIEVLASSAPTALSAVVVASVVSRADPSRRAVLTRRRWIAGGLREDIHLHNTGPHPQQWTVHLLLAADFAHLFDVKAGATGERRGVTADGDQWKISSKNGDANGDAVTRIAVAPSADQFDVVDGALTWTLEVEPRSELVITITAEPEVDGELAGLAFPVGQVPADAIPMHRLSTWKATVPSVVSPDPRMSEAVDQALADIAALRIVDAAHADRVVVAAGAPWFMTLFGRDSLLTSWMTLPFEPTLAVGVLNALADLQGTVDDPAAEEQPGKILHELRRHGGGGPFADRSRYYGTVDATPLFVMLASEAVRWKALSESQLAELAPAIDAAVEWVCRDGDSNGDGFVDYARSHASGLSNQGWKDSWDGVTFSDGSLPSSPIALAEVQGYAYAALCGAAELAGQMSFTRPTSELLERASILRGAFNERFWDERGWFVLGVDGAGRQIDSLTTNPGHALWAGIADPALADQYLDRLADGEMFTGWGLRTLGDTMGAYDPLSYHNGSVWPHDTALCAAGAARYGRWDVVDLIVDGALDAAREFGGRPPELFAGISRDEAPMPVAYPSSCSPQAWSSASILLLVRSMLDLAPSAGGDTLEVGRTDLSGVPDMRIERLVFGQQQFTVEIQDATAAVHQP